LTKVKQPTQAIDYLALPIYCSQWCFIFVARKLSEYILGKNEMFWTVGTRGACKARLL